jgi:hypothetical protein
VDVSFSSFLCAREKDNYPAGQRPATTRGAEARASGKKKKLGKSCKYQIYAVFLQTE